MIKNSNSTKLFLFLVVWQLAGTVAFGQGFCTELSQMALLGQKEDFNSLKGKQIDPFNWVAARNLPGVKSGCIYQKGGEAWYIGLVAEDIQYDSPDANKRISELEKMIKACPQLGQFSYSRQEMKRSDMFYEEGMRLFHSSEWAMRGREVGIMIVQDTNSQTGKKSILLKIWHAIENWDDLSSIHGVTHGVTHGFDPEAVSSHRPGVSRQRRRSV